MKRFLFIQMLLVSHLFPAHAFAGTAGRAANEPRYTAAGAAFTVSGKVMDEAGELLAGATVAEKGTNNGTATDAAGGFRLTVADGNATLVVTYTGYSRQEVAINNQSTLEIRLAVNFTTLSDVVVVGYGAQKRSDLTGAVSSVDSKTLREVPAANLVQSLTGRVAGVDIARTSTRPGAGGQIRIRGNRSLSGSNDPLLVVDGIPYAGNIGDLNPDDIVSIEILKDASATAIYGSRGSNGVLIISTRRGVEGKPVVQFNTYYGLSSPVGEYDVFNGAEFKAFRDESKYGAPNSGYTADELAGIANGTSTDWQSHMYNNNGYITNHDLSVSGGTEKTRYSLGGGYFKENGIMVGQAFQRFSLRSTLDQKIGKRINIGLNTMNSLSYTDGEGVNSMYNSIALSPLTEPYRADGSLNIRPSSPTDEYVNPIILQDKNAWKEQRRRIRTYNSLYGEVNLFKGLKYRLNVGLDFRQDHYGQYLGANTPFNNSATGNSANISNGEEWRTLVENILTYENTFNEKHRLTLTGLFSAEKNQGQFSRIQTTGILADYLQYYNFNLASAPAVPGNTAGEPNNNNFFQQGLLSYMGRMNYVFDNRYMLTATLRADGSSVLAEGNQWFMYPAFALGWNVANESFLQNLDVISTLKLRAGYGTTSNQSVAPYSTLGSLGISRYNYGATGNNVFGYYVNTLPNKNLSWEATTSTNFGIDLGLFNGRIAASLEVYSQKTNDVLIFKQLPQTSGTAGYTANVGKTKGNGIELMLSTVNFSGRRMGGFKWTTDLNFAVNREEIVELAEPGLQRDLGNGWFVGQPITVIYDYNKLGIWQTSEADQATAFSQKPGQIKVEDSNGDGKINADDRQIIGNFQPKWIGGLTNRFEFKGFDFSVVAFARMGMKLVANYFQSDGSASGYYSFMQGRRNQVKVDYWTADNPTNAFPQPDGTTDRPLYGTTLGYYDGSFIKIRSMSLGYNLSKNLADRMKIGGLRIYVTAQNPFIVYSPFVSDGHGIDPEGAGTGAGQANSAINSAVPNRAILVSLNTPPTKSFIFGLNLTL